VFLNHTSPVFKALLGPHFKEGKLLAASSSVEVPLPDDNPIAMEIISLVLHHRDVPSELDAGSLLSVVKHCDKYDVFVATRPAINLWIDTCLEATDSTATMIMLLQVAFKSRLWLSVNKLGVLIVQKADSDISDPEVWEIESYEIPFYLFGW
jgi:hypothetical protein